MTDTVIERNEEINSYSFLVSHDEPAINNIFIIFLDPQFNIVWMERPLLNFLGEPLSHFLGKDIFEVITCEEIISLLLVPKNIENSYNFSEFLFCTSPFTKKILRNCNLRMKLYQNDRGMITGYFLIIAQSEKED